MKGFEDLRERKRCVVVCAPPHRESRKNRLVCVQELPCEVSRRPVLLLQPNALEGAFHLKKVLVFCTQNVAGKSRRACAGTHVAFQCLGDSTFLSIASMFFSLVTLSWPDDSHEHHAPHFMSSVRCTHNRRISHHFHHTLFILGLLIRERFTRSSTLVSLGISSYMSPYSRRELSELVSHHILRYLHIVIDLAIVDLEDEAHEVW